MPKTAFWCRLGNWWLLVTTNKDISWAAHMIGGDEDIVAEVPDEGTVRLRREKEAAIGLAYLAARDGRVAIDAEVDGAKKQSIAQTLLQTLLERM